MRGVGSGKYLANLPPFFLFYNPLGIVIHIIKVIALIVTNSVL